MHWRVWENLHAQTGSNGFIPRMNCAYIVYSENTVNKEDVLQCNNTDYNQNIFLISPLTPGQCLLLQKDSVLPYLIRAGYWIFSTCYDMYPSPLSVSLSHLKDSWVFCYFIREAEFQDINFFHINYLPVTTVSVFVTSEGFSITCF